jgi:hypothetical protein
VYYNKTTSWEEQDKEVHKLGFHPLEVANVRNYNSMESRSGGFLSTQVRRKLCMATVTTGRRAWRAVINAKGLEKTNAY